MPKMIHRATTRVATTLGHVIRFEADTEVDVPQAAVEAALHYGARLVEEKAAPKPGRPAKAARTVPGVDVAPSGGDAVQ